MQLSRSGDGAGGSEKNEGKMKGKMDKK